MAEAEKSVARKRKRGQKSEAVEEEKDSNEDKKKVLLSNFQDVVDDLCRTKTELAELLSSNENEELNSNECDIYLNRTIASVSMSIRNWGLWKIQIEKL